MPPVLIADRYHVLRELGRGGMGVVYQVLHKETGEQYALKVLLAHTATKGDSVERFKRELKLPARIKSEHVVQVIDSGEVKEEGDAPFYVMELLRGCDLRQLIDAKHAFSTREIIWILRQLAQGLSRAHEIGIVHRDLKPETLSIAERLASLFPASSKISGEKELPTRAPHSPHGHGSAYAASTPYP